MIEFACKCGKKVTAPDDAGGKFGKCPHCGVQVQVPTVPIAAPVPENLGCPACGHLTQSGAKFCEECGSPLAQGDTPSPATSQSPQGQPPVPAQGVAIEFGHSSSADYEFAVQEAEKQPTYATWGEKRKTRHRVNYATADLGEAANLWSLVSRWKSSRVYLDGKPVKPDSVFGFVKCLETRESAYSPDAYCFLGDKPGFSRFNPWGCIQLRMPLAGWSQPWLQCGHWDRKKNWHFDKQRIQHGINQAMNTVRFCPHVRREVIQRMIAAWPDYVDPFSDEDWTHIDGHGDGPNVVTVKMVEREDGYTFERTIYAVGAKPKDDNAAIRIWARVLARAGMDNEPLVAMIKSHG